MAKYKKRENGLYYTQLATGQYTEAGRPKYKTLYGKTQAELDAKVQEFHAQQKQGFIADNKIMASKWLDMYIETYVQPLRKNTQSSYLGMISKHIRPAIGSMRLIDVKRHHLQKLLNDVANSTYGPKEKPYSQKTIKEIRSLLYAIFEQAAMDEIIPRNPASKLTVSGAQAVKREALTTEQQRIALEAAKTARIGPIVLLMYYCGLRRGEALALTVNDVRDGRLTINKQVTYPDVEGQVGRKALLSPPKTKAGVREVPIPKPLEPVLMDAVAKTKQACSLILFEGSDSGYLSYSSIKRGWESFEKTCNKISDGAFGHVVEHQLRHTYCTNLFEMGVDMLTAQKYMGHDNIETTLKIYTHLREEKEKKSESAVSEWAVST